jgi:hypothetical protein
VKLTIRFYIVPRSGANGSLPIFFYCVMLIRRGNFTFHRYDKPLSERGRIPLLRAMGSYLTRVSARRPGDGLHGPVNRVLTFCGFSINKLSDLAYRNVGSAETCPIATSQEPNLHSFRIPLTYAQFITQKIFGRTPATNQGILNTRAVCTNDTKIILLLMHTKFW